MHSHTTCTTMAIVPLDMVRANLLDLWKLDKVQCSQMLKSYNGTAAASAEPMTASVLALTVVLMLLLTVTLLCLGMVRLFVGLGHKTLNLEPVVRVFLRVTFVLFLPVLASVFSLTKAQGGAGFLLTLLWFLLVELIRMKVQVMVLPADGSSFSRSVGRFTLMDNADEVGHMVWAGYLVFFNMEGHARDEADKKWADAMRAMFAILWLLGFLKLTQRIFNTWMESWSWHTGRNPLLIAAYMQLVKEEEEEKKNGHVSTPPPPPGDPTDAVMEMCPFVVEGEHKLVFREKKNKKAQPKVVTTIDYDRGVGGCPGGQSGLKHVSAHLDLADDDKTTSRSSKIVTVGMVWKWRKETSTDIGHLFSDDDRGRDLGLYIQDLCLSFSLFKLLRRRFEQYPMVEVGSDMARRVMLEGLLNLKLRGRNGDPDGADRPFRVLQLELDFLRRYYQAADRVLMSNIKLFIPNILLSMLFVPIYLVAILAILVSTKDADYFYCMAVVSVSTGHRLIENFPFLSFSITLALLATLICFEAYEFFTTYINLNSNLVRLVCYYGALTQASNLTRKSLYYMFVIRYRISRFTRSLIFWRQVYKDIQINQVSIVDAYGPIDKLSICTKKPIQLATKAKKNIIQVLKLIRVDNPTISLPQQPGVVGPTDDGEITAATGRTTTMTTTTTSSTTEIILASHLATELFNIEHKKKKKTKKWQADDVPVDDDDHARVVAITLSRYCMYLVAHMPEVLPDDEVWVSERFKDMRTCLANVLQNCCRWGCMLCRPCRCCKDTMLHSLMSKRQHLDKTTLDAVELLDRIRKIGDDAEAWNQLANFWVRLVIYLAPSNDVQGHAKAVATSGGDLISCLWAFCTHAGITRQPQEQLHGHGV